MSMKTPFPSPERVLFAALVWLLVAHPGLAQEIHGPAAGMWSQIPETAADHLQLAREYRQRATQLRMDADVHRQMKQTYRNGVGESPKGTARPWWGRMQSHCDHLVAQANSLAKEMEEFAAFHDRRAADLSARRSP